MNVRNYTGLSAMSCYCEIPVYVRIAFTPAFDTPVAPQAASFTRSQRKKKFVLKFTDSVSLGTIQIFFLPAILTVRFQVLTAASLKMAGCLLGCCAV
jgi:hypothetical protein